MIKSFNSKIDFLRICYKRKYLKGKYTFTFSVSKNEVIFLCVSSHIKIVAEAHSSSFQAICELLRGKPKNVYVLFIHILRPVGR